VGECTAIAHQVHGAIGFTIEYGLHRLTRRLWSWRSDFGSDAHWAGWLGARVAAAGPDRFWADIADRTDTKDTE
jgi:acyl-CoA dehydrogenase